MRKIALGLTSSLLLVLCLFPPMQKVRDGLYGTSKETTFLPIWTSRSWDVNSITYEASIDVGMFAAIAVGILAVGGLMFALSDEE